MKTEDIVKNILNNNGAAVISKINQNGTVEELEEFINHCETLNDEEFLAHWGIKGMKWGVINEVVEKLSSSDKIKYKTLLDRYNKLTNNTNNQSASPSTNVNNTKISKEKLADSVVDRNKFAQRYVEKLKAENAEKARVKAENEKLKAEEEANKMKTISKIEPNNKNLDSVSEESIEKNKEEHKNNAQKIDELNTASNEKRLKEAEENRKAMDPVARLAAQQEELQKAKDLLEAKKQEEIYQKQYETILANARKNAKEQAGAEYNRRYGHDEQLFRDHQEEYKRLLEEQYKLAEEYAKQEIEKIKKSNETGSKVKHSDLEEFINHCETLNDEEFLAHWGIKGMKWGVINETVQKLSTSARAKFNNLLEKYKKLTSKTKETETDEQREARLKEAEAFDKASDEKHAKAKAEAEAEVKARTEKQNEESAARSDAKFKAEQEIAKKAEKTLTQLNERYDDLLNDVKKTSEISPQYGLVITACTSLLANCGLHPNETEYNLFMAEQEKAKKSYESVCKKYYSALYGGTLTPDEQRRYSNIMSQSRKAIDDIGLIQSMIKQYRDAQEKYKKYGPVINHSDLEEDDYLAHWGILGQKWGVRRYQNPDGTLTPEGKARYGSPEELENYRKLQENFEKNANNAIGSTSKAFNQMGDLVPKKAGHYENKYKSSYKKTKYSKLSNEELSQRINRLNLENRYADLVGDNKYVKSGQEKARETFQSLGSGVALLGTMVTIGQALRRMNEGSSGTTLLNVKK